MTTMPYRSGQVGPMMLRRPLPVILAVLCVLVPLIARSGTAIVLGLVLAGLNLARLLLAPSAGEPGPIESGIDRS